MKTVVISDLHLTSHFDSKKFDYLKDLINAYDRIIINGDFWSYYSNTFDEFLNSDWKKLFPILKKKKAIFIYGNHDRKRWCDKRVSQFSLVARENYKLRQGKYTYYIEHGHKILKADSVQNETYISFWRNMKFDALVRENLTRLILKLKKMYFINNFFAKRLIKRAYGLSANLKENEFLVIGHVHQPFISYKQKLICTGIIGYGISQYLEVTEAGPKLINETY